VAIVTQGRHVRAPNFTRYLSVLAMGDSLTWGVSNMFVGGVRVPVNVQRSYPRGVKTALEASPQFGQYALVSNAGWPGEWVTQGGFNQSPGAVARSARCTAGQANCFYFQSPDPRDYFTPHDVAVFLEGVNDLNNSISPATVRSGMRGMVVDAKAKGLQVLLALFGPYGIDQQTGQDASIPAAVREYNNLLDALAVEQSVSRERVQASMGPDGLHPTQTGYDEMASTISRKLLTMFPRCAAGVSTCQ
jgi:lysophospholipase L1-like esterase